MRFVLTIELGNDAMQTAGDLAGALRKLASRFATQHDVVLADAYGEHRSPLFDLEGPIRDENGNRVGGWHVE